MPKNKGRPFVKGDPRCHRGGRAPVAEPLAEKIRRHSGKDAQKVVETYEAIMWRKFPKVPAWAPSSRAQFVASITQLANELTSRDRMSAFEQWVDRGYPKPKTDVEHTGGFTITWQQP
jgi:hypothetical protein